MIRSGENGIVTAVRTDYFPAAIAPGRLGNRPRIGGLRSFVNYSFYKVRAVERTWRQ